MADPVYDDNGVDFNHINVRLAAAGGGPDNLRWFWSMTVNGPMTRSDRVATLEEAKAQFQKSWDAWKAWAKLEETE